MCAWVTSNETYDYSSQQTFKLSFEIFFICILCHKWWYLLGILWLLNYLFCLLLAMIWNKTTSKEIPLTSLLYTGLYKREEKSLVSFYNQKVVPKDYYLETITLLHNYIFLVSQFLLYVKHIMMTLKQIHSWTCLFRYLPRHIAVTPWNWCFYFYPQLHLYCTVIVEFE